MYEHLGVVLPGTNYEFKFGTINYQSDAGAFDNAITAIVTWLAQDLGIESIFDRPSVIFRPASEVAANWPTLRAVLR